MDDKQQNIGFFNSHKDWGGGEKWHYETALFFLYKGFNVVFFSHKKSLLYKKLIKHNIIVEHISVRNLSFLNIFHIIKLVYKFRKLRLNALIIALPSDVKLAGIAAKIAGVKKIIYRRGTALPVKYSLLNKLIYKYILTDVIANSYEIKNQMFGSKSNLMHTDKIHVIYNGINISANGIHEKNMTEEKQNKMILGNAGRLVEQKGQAYLIEVAEYLKSYGYDFHLYIAGKGKLYSQLMQMRDKLNLREEVTFLDFINDMTAFLNSLDIFLFPSIHEGTSNVLLEAMALKKTVVAFNISSIPEIIVHEENGLLAEFKNTQDFSDKVARLMNDNELRKRLSNNAKKSIHTQFDQKKNFEQLLALIK